MFCYFLSRIVYINPVIPLDLRNVSLAPRLSLHPVKWSALRGRGSTLETHTFVSHPRLVRADPNKGAMPCFARLSVAKRQPVSHSKPGHYRPSAWRYLLACPSYSGGGPRKLPRTAPRSWVAFAPALRIWKPISPRTAHHVYTSRKKIISLDLLSLIPPFARFHHVVR